VPDVILESPIATGRRLRLVFAWHIDRFGHSVELVQGGRSIPILVSAEGTAAEAWPPSPPLQQLHLEDRGERVRVALLVGMAGNCHWSLSVDATPDGSSLVFDAACRCHGSQAALGSWYRFGSPDATEGSSGQLDLGDTHCRDGKLGWQLRTLSTAPDGRSRLVRVEQRLGVVAPVTAGATVRWKYCVELNRVAPGSALNQLPDGDQPFL
jgi:hypothetical protein